MLSVRLNHDSLHIIKEQLNYDTKRIIYQGTDDI